MPRENPYIAGNPVGKTNAFIGRTDILNELENFLKHSQQNTIVLYGQRRIGKTSLLHFLEKSLPNIGNFAPVYYNLQDKASWSLGKLLENLAQTINAKLGTNNILKGKNEDEIQAKFRSEWLPFLLKNLPKKEKEPNLDALVVLFDEFDVLADPASEKAGATFFPYFRHLISDDPERLKFVFTLGRNIDDLNTGALSLFKDIRAKRVSLLNEEETYNLINLSTKNETLLWSEGALKHIRELTNGHPYLTQQLCFTAWLKHHRPNGNKKIMTPNDIDAIIDDTLDASRTALEWIWEGLPPAERVVISALSEAGPQLATQTDLEKILNDSGIKIIIRELQNAPRLLEDWDLIEPKDDGYIFRVELLRRWLYKYKKLKTVIDETDRIKPAAENLYQAAHNLYNNGQSDQLDQVINFLREAIRLNPNHLKANGLLSDILISKNQLDDAEKILNTLYDIHPNAARARLVQIYYARAEQAENDENKIIHLNKILEISSDNIEALKALSTIWKNIGDRALDNHQLKEALEAYRIANDKDNYNLVVNMIREEELKLFIIDISALELEKRYDDALELITSKLKIFKWHDWSHEISRLEQKSTMNNLLLRAKTAFENKDLKIAQEHLIKIINIDPEFEDAAQFLFMATEKGSAYTDEKIKDLESQVLSLQTAATLVEQKNNQDLKNEISRLKSAIELDLKRVDELLEENSRLKIEVESKQSRNEAALKTVDQKINQEDIDRISIYRASTNSISTGMSKRDENNNIPTIAFLVFILIIETLMFIFVLTKLIELSRLA